MTAFDSSSSLHASSSLRPASLASAPEEPPVTATAKNGASCVTGNGGGFPSGQLQPPGLVQNRWPMASGSSSVLSEILTRPVPVTITTSAAEVALYWLIVYGAAETGAESPFATCDGSGVAYPSGIPGPVMSHAPPREGSRNHPEDHESRKASASAPDASHAGSFE